MLCLIAILLLFATKPAAEDFESRIKQLEADRIEAFHLCSSVRGQFGFQYMISLGNSNLSWVYFPAGRADRIFISNLDLYGKKSSAGYEIREGRARRLWTLKCLLSAKGGRLHAQGLTVRVTSRAWTDLRRQWALTSFTSENMGGQSFNFFIDQRGKASAEERNDQGGTFPALKPERAWLKAHGFPNVPPVRESPGIMQEWRSRAERLPLERTRLVLACERLATGRPPVETYTFPMGRSDLVFVDRPVDSKSFDAEAYEWNRGAPLLRWRVRIREQGRAEGAAFLFGFRVPKNAPTAMKADMRKPLAVIDYQILEQGSLASIWDDLGEMHQEENIAKGSFKTIDGEILYLRANRPWPSR